MVRTLFFKPKSKRLARIITIRNPAAFRRAVRILSKGGLSLKEKRALVLAQNRARAQLNRKNLSVKEFREMKEIASIRLPKITKGVDQ